MLGIMKDKRQLLKENTHSSKDTEEQTTCSLKHNWKVVSPLHSTCFPKLGAAWETAALFLLFLLSLCLGADERLFPSHRWGKITQIFRPKVLHQLFLHCLRKATSTFSLLRLILAEGLTLYLGQILVSSVLSVSPWGGCWKLVIWYSPRIPQNGRKQSKPSTFSQGGKAISSSSCKTGADWKVSGKVIMPFDESIRKPRLVHWCEKTFLSLT